MRLIRGQRLRAFVYRESKVQKAKNMETFQKPDSLSWEDWMDHRRPGYFKKECHWYDPRPSGCVGSTYHDHTSVVMKWYRKGPGKIISPLALAWEARYFIISDILDRLGWYRLLERFGVDTSPEMPTMELHRHE